MNFEATAEIQTSNKRVGRLRCIRMKGRQRRTHEES